MPIFGIPTINRSKSQRFHDDVDSPKVGSRPLDLNPSKAKTKTDGSSRL